MANEIVTGRDTVTDDDLGEGAEARARLIDALMAGPPKERPAITVLGDEAVFGITPAKRPD